MLNLYLNIYFKKFEDKNLSNESIKNMQWFFVGYILWMLGLARIAFGIDLKSTRSDLSDHLLRQERKLPGGGAGADGPPPTDSPTPFVSQSVCGPLSESESCQDCIAAHCHW